VKTSFLFILFLGITFLGCSDNFDNTLTSIPIQTEELTKSAIPENVNELTGFEEFPKSPDSEVLTHSITSKDIKDQVICPILAVSKSINGQTGGSLIIDTTYVNYQGRLLYVYARLKVKEFAFNGTAEISMILRPEDGLIELYPHMVFDNEVELSVTYEGIDLKELGFNTTADINFVYFNENGDIEIIDDKTAKVDLSKQQIKVTNAKLYHFSRYGWVR
jgi:hypothetical protein